MMAFRVVRPSDVPYLDTPLEPQSQKQDRLWKPERVMGDSWETRAGHSRGITFRLPGVPPASAGPRNISQAYGQRAEGSLPGFGPL